MSPARRSMRSAAVWMVATAMLVVADAAQAQYVQGERDRRAPRAVKATAFSLLVPIYDHTTIADGGWREDESVKENRLGVVASLVVPLGQSWGWRTLLGGGWSNFEQSELGGLPAVDEQFGDFLVGVSFFRRNPELGQVGLSYLYRGRETDFTNGSRRNRLGIVADLYTERFDWGFDFGYAFGQTEGESGTSGGVPVEGIDREFDGFVASVDGRWYANDRWSAVLGVEVEVQTQKATSGGATQSNVETTAVGPLMKVTWLPPLGRKSWLVLEGSFSYARLKGSVASGGVPRDEDVNRFGAGASVRIHLPRVESLQELIREY